MGDVEGPDDLEPFLGTCQQLEREVKEEPIDYQDNDEECWEADERVSIPQGLSTLEEGEELPVKYEELVKNEITVNDDYTIHTSNNSGVENELLFEPPVFSRSGRLVKRLLYIPPPPPRPVKRKPSLPPPPPPRPPDQHFCLLCYKTTEKNSTNSTPNVAERDFQVMFVLKKMLNIPKENLADYLKLMGDPRDWLTFCNTCVVTVNKAIVVQKEITRLEESLRSYQKEMTEKIKRTRKSKPETQVASHKDVLRVTNETREFVATGKCTLLTCTRIINPKPKIDPKEAARQQRRAQRSGRGKRNTTRSMRLRALKARAAIKVGLDLENVPLPNLNEVSMDSAPRKQVAINLNVPIPIAPEETISSRNRGPPKRQRRRHEVSASDADIAALKKMGYHCSLCPHIKEMDFHSLNQHILFHYKHPYKCSVCNIYHSSIIPDEQSETCALNASRKANNEEHLCSSSTLSKTLFQPGKIWSCEYCEKGFNSDLERDSHETECSQLDTQQCPILLERSCITCERKFRNVAEWRLHTILEHPDKATYSCCYCDETFVVKTKEEIDLLDYESLKNHLWTCHSGSKMENRLSRVCEFCGEVFWVATTLRDHVITEHKMQKNQTVSCEICQYRTSEWCLLLLHLKKIHYLEGKTQRVSICEQCGYETVQKFKMEHHKFMEHGVEPKKQLVLSCQEEGCSFKTVGNVAMKKHKMKVHNAARKHTCEVCGKGFLNSSKLRTHQQIHLNKNVKPFQCEICGNSFGVKNYLYIHMRLSHQNRPFASTHKKKPPRKKDLVSKTSCNVNGDEDRSGESSDVLFNQPLPKTSGIQSSHLSPEPT